MNLRAGKNPLSHPVVRLLVTGLALLLVLRTVDVSAVLPLFARAHFLYLASAIGVILLTRVLMAWKWKLLLYYGGIDISLGYLLRIVLVSAFMGIFLPSSVGVDIIRTAAVGRRTGYTSAAVSTIADRVMAIVAMALWSLTAALIALWAAPDLQHLLLPIVALCVGVVVTLMMLLSDTAIRTVQRRILRSSSTRTNRQQVTSSGVSRLIHLVTNKAILIHQELRDLFAKPSVFISVFSVNVVFQGIRIILFYLLFLVVGAHVAFVYHIIFAPIIMFVTLLPFSFLGIGIKEVAVVFFYTRVGVDPASALAVSIWTYIVTIPPTAIGGLFYLLGASADLAAIQKNQKSSNVNENA